MLTYHTAAAVYTMQAPRCFENTKSLSAQDIPTSYLVENCPNINMDYDKNYRALSSH